MPSRPEWTFSKVTVFDETRVYVLAYTSEQPGTRVFRWTGKRDNFHIPAVTAGICSVRGHPPEILTLCAEGQVHRAAPDGLSLTRITPEHSNRHGILRDIRAVGQHVLVAGQGRQVFIRTPDGRWSRHDQGMLASATSDSLSGFESIDGFDENDLYAVGHLGEIWWRNPEGWQRIDSPTDVILENVLCAPDGKVYVSGQLGTLLIGRERGWKSIQHSATDDTFWDMAWFAGSLWLSTKAALYRFDGKELKRVDTGIPGQTFRYLDATEKTLWSSGERHLAGFDGQAWALVPSP